MVDIPKQQVELIPYQYNLYEVSNHNSAFQSDEDALRRRSNYYTSASSFPSQTHLVKSPLSCLASVKPESFLHVRILLQRFKLFVQPTNWFKPSNSQHWSSLPSDSIPTGSSSSIALKSKPTDTTEDFAFLFKNGPAEEPRDFCELFTSRLTCLIILLILQSLASFILEGFSSMFEHHNAIVYYLTMIIGCGGSAGSQSSVLMIRGMATREYNSTNYPSIICAEFYHAICFSIILSVITFLRVLITERDMREILAVTVSMGIVILISVMSGCLLPLVLKKFKLDPEHAGAGVQVLIDIVSVLIVCSLSLFIFKFT